MIELVGTDNTLQDVSQQNFNLANATLQNSLQQNAQVLQNDQQWMTNNVAAMRQQTQSKLNADLAKAEAEGNPNTGLTGLISGVAKAGIEYLNYSRQKELQDYKLKVEEQVLKNKANSEKLETEQLANFVSTKQNIQDLYDKFQVKEFRELGPSVGALQYKDQALKAVYEAASAGKINTKQLEELSAFVASKVTGKLDD